jgi:sugar phosphate isomerase/epimerase
MHPPETRFTLEPNQGRQIVKERWEEAMKFALHAGTVRHTNLAIDITAARRAGFEGVELFLPKVARYLDAGFDATDVRQMLGPLDVPMIDFLMPIESQDPGIRARVDGECQRMAKVAEVIGCPAIQVVALNEFPSSNWTDQKAVLVSRLRELSEIAAPHGVRLAIEGAIFSPFRQLAQALEVIEVLGVDRVGLCLDTWHLWLGGTPWEQVAELDPAFILSVQLADTAARSGTDWQDEDRTALPGEGVLPLGDAIDAVLATGYTGYWTYEMVSARHQEWEPEDFANAMLTRMRTLINERVGR